MLQYLGVHTSIKVVLLIMQSLPKQYEGDVQYFENCLTKFHEVTNFLCYTKVHNIHIVDITYEGHQKLAHIQHSLTWWRTHSNRRMISN